MNQIDTGIKGRNSIIVLSSIVLLLSISGLIMDASGVPWIASGEDYNSESQKYDYYNSESWDECCKEDYEIYLQHSDSVQDSTDTVSLFNSPLTSYFVLILIFSVICLTVTLIPFNTSFKLPIVTLLGLSTATTGIFLTRKFIITFGFYFDALSNLGDREPPFHLDIMVYYGGLIGLTCLILGAIVITVLKNNIMINSLNSAIIIDRARVFLGLALFVFLFSPLVPISYVTIDTNSEFYNEKTDNSQIVLPVRLLMLDDLLDGNTVIDPETRDIVENTAGNYALVEDLFFTLMWINMSVIMLISLSVIPKVGFIFEGIAQINILSIPLIIIALIFTILMYVYLPDIVGVDGIYSEGFYYGMYFHANWIMLLCCLVGIVNWIILLIKSHIPWWKTLTSVTATSEINSVKHNTIWERKERY